MPYLTYEEFIEATHLDIDKYSFKKLYTKASAILDNITNYYYHHHDITEDNSWRVRQFKQALCSQMEYFAVLGSTTFEEINKTPQSFQAGRTSVSNASRFNPRGKNESKSLAAEEVYMHLSGTGLLYSGVNPS
ncbi:hypothetical protein [Planococcus beigongshangi]|uniref:hypothetical protein n=1 Tax=Planococcus beigongshangi TaxID=2782536 RepID=UPI00193C7554|nr:hypothetical protein [Planococcus beigongshangi]